MNSEIFFTKNPLLPNYSIQDIKLRNATIDDLEFIIEAIIGSEKSGSQIISTCTAFNITENEYKEILREILPEDITNSEYSLSGFLIAEYNNEPVGTYNSWLEAQDGITSGIIKTSIFTPFLDQNKIMEMQANKKLIAALSLQREVGALQLEYLYVRNKFRRRGIASYLTVESIKRNLDRYFFSKVQTILFKDNMPSFCTHLKLGFQIAKEKSTQDENILQFYPYKSKVLMELCDDKIQKF